MPELYDLAGGCRRSSNLAAGQRDRVAVADQPAADLQRGAAEPARAGIGRGRGRAALARLRSGQRARRATSTPKPTTRSASSRSIAICTRRRSTSRTAGRTRRSRCSRASSRGGPTPPTPTSRWRTRYWEAGRVRGGDRDARDAAEERRARSRHPHPARHLPRREPHRHRRAPSRCSKGLPPTTPKR